MAGTYADAPSRRFAYDADGTVLLYSYDRLVSAATPSHTRYSSLSEATAVLMNREYLDSLIIKADTRYPRQHFMYIFPEDREIDGAYGTQTNEFNTGAAYSNLSTSEDAKGPHEGTWTLRLSNFIYNHDYYSSVLPVGHYRDNITSMALNSVSALEVIQRNQNTSGDHYSGIVHLYGTISPGATPDRILFLDTLNADAVFTKVLDYGDVPRGQTQQRTIKLKNNSASKTINTIQITAEDLYLNAGGWFLFSTDDVSYQATLSYGNLGPGAATTPIYVKQEIPDAETLGPQTGRLKVSHATVT